MEYDLGSGAGDRAYFANATSDFGINDSEAYKLANTPHYLQSFVTQHKLTALTSEFLGAVQSGSITISVSRISDGSNCQWPFTALLNVSRTRGSAISLMFLRKLKEPKIESYDLRCEVGPGKVNLVMRYQSVAPLLFSDSRSRIFLGLDRPASVFSVNSAGSSIRVSLSPGVIVIAADLAENLYRLAAENKISPQQGVDRLEAEIDKYVKKRGKVRLP